MDPHNLISPENPLGYPAPFWFIEFFKVLGFILHIIPMHLWYAGLLVIMMVRILGKGAPLRATKRLASAMPIIVALGINFGVIPLLFTQVAYYQFFYPAGILIAWPWISVIGLLMIAYYSVYFYAVQIRKGTVTRLGKVAGCASACIFIIIGFLFVNNFSLMANPGRWYGIYMATAIGGSPHGIALNTGDPTLLPRWLMMFGLALTTVAVYLAIDAAFFVKANAEQHRAQISRFLILLYTIGAAIFAAMGSWYIFGTLPEEITKQMWQTTGSSLLFAATGIMPLIVWLILVLQHKGIRRGLAAVTGIAQFLTLGLNAISRQWVQNLEIGRYLDVSKGKVILQLSPMIMFLISFLIGAWIIWWMLKQVRNAKPAENPVAY